MGDRKKTLKLIAVVINPSFKMNLLDLSHAAVLSGNILCLKGETNLHDLLCYFTWTKKQIASMEIINFDFLSIAKTFK